MIELRQKEFFEEYNINKMEFEKAEINWETLMLIYEDHKKHFNILGTAANTISEILRTHPEVHSVRSRVKNPQNLIEKIIRKTFEKQLEKPEYQVTLENYTKEITDLIGIRVLHLYKDQAFNIDEMIREMWELQEKAKINHREGDITDSFIQEHTDRFEFKKHKAGYRSWHYLIKTQITKRETIAEIQVRTIFEEGWSEIDHQLRYPYELNNSLLNSQLLVLNRLAGSADEMVNTIKDTLDNNRKMNIENDKQNEVIASLKEEITKLMKNKQITEDDNISVQKKLKKLEEKQNEYFVTIDHLRPFRDVRVKDLRDNIRIIDNTLNNKKEID